MTPYCVFDGLFSALQAHAPHGTLNNLLPGHPKVAQGKNCYQLGGVLGQPFVVNLSETKLAFENPEGMPQKFFILSGLSSDKANIIFPSIESATDAL